MVFHRGPQGLKTSSLLMVITLALASSLASASVQVLYTTDTNPSLVDRMEQGQAYVVGFATSGGCCAAATAAAWGPALSAAHCLPQTAC